MPQQQAIRIDLAQYQQAACAALPAWPSPEDGPRQVPVQARPSLGGRVRVYHVRRNGGPAGLMEPVRSPG